MGRNATVVRGDILTAKEQIICHQVNLLGVMGAGLALQIRTKYPGVYEKYRRYCFDAELGDVCFCETGDGKIIANIFAQSRVGVKGLFTNYPSLYTGFLKVKKFMGKDKTVAIPYKIGCGLAGGDWGVVSNLIGYAFFDTDVMIYRL